MSLRQDLPALPDFIRRPEVHNVTVTGLTRVTRPKPNLGGSTVLAYFDCEANGIVLRKCAFVRTSRRGLTVWGPKLEEKGEPRAVMFNDERLRSQLTREAQATYRALGGTDGEWEPRDRGED